MLAETIEEFARDCVERHETCEEALEHVVRLRPLFFETLALLEREANPLVCRGGRRAAASGAVWDKPRPIDIHRRDGFPTSGKPEEEEFCSRGGAEDAEVSRAWQRFALTSTEIDRPLARPDPTPLRLRASAPPRESSCLHVFASWRE